MSRLETLFWGARHAVAHEAIAVTHLGAGWRRGESNASCAVA